MARAIALVAGLAGAILWAVLSVMPPAPRGSDTPPTAFSADRAFMDIVAIGRAPHPVGSPENARVRAYLVGRLRALGAKVSEQAALLPRKSLDRLGKWSGRREQGVVAHNAIGVIAGRDRARPALLLMAHFDSVWGSPGAADDAMGIAAALEVARALRAQGQPLRDVILLFTDSEEIDLDGSTAFFAQHPLAAHVGMIINMEARGASGRANMFETGSANGAQMRLYADNVARPATNSLSVLIYDMMPNYTAYTIAKRRGIAGFNLAVLDRGYAYHSPFAVPKAVDAGSLQDMGDQALALASAMAFAANLPARTPNAAFADLLGRVTIAYPTAAGWAILLLAGTLIAAALSRTRPGLRSIGRAMIVTVTLLLHASLLLTMFNAVSGSGGANYYDRLAALPRLEAVAALAIVALMLLLDRFRRPQLRAMAIAPAMALMWVGLLTGGPLVPLAGVALTAMAAAWFLPVSSDDRGEGAALLLLGAGAVVQAVEPTAAPLLHWPLLLGAIALAARAWLPAALGLVIGAICAAIGIGHLLAQAHFIFLAIGAEMPAVMIALLFAALPLILPLLPAQFPRWMPGIALAAAMLLALWVRLDPIAPSVPAYSRAEGGTKTRD
ncbi:M20/M25/M40 family metallo-hydrolase [Rhizorhabdus argentea]|uniref:M20/M25/M40 family metallo-hydrolase n=1 Tax=Rhizorhabdus argentea TaxID=1387174 RepID=UPI0030EEC26A